MNPLQKDPLLRNLPVEEDGVRLGKVILKNKIGAGGMGSVYLAHHTGLDIDVAVKIIPFDDEDDTESPNTIRFTREAQSAALINHPNLVRVFALGEDAGLKYIIQEYVHGLSGGEYMEQYGALGEDKALDIIAQVALALEAAHEAGIIHRDIKPDNILIMPDGSVKLADLGLAKKVDVSSSEDIKLNFDITAANTAIGTPHFMAPEQVTNAREVDHRADLYSLGVTLYQFLTLALPYMADNIYALFHSILHEPPAPMPPVDPPLIQSTYRLVHWMMNKDANQRPQNAVDVFNAVDDILACKEAGTDNWYPPHAQPPSVQQQAPNPALAYSPTLMIDTPQEPGRSAAEPYPTAPMPAPVSRPKTEPTSKARQRLARLKTYAQEVAAQGVNKVEFVIPDILKKRDRIPTIRAPGGTSKFDPLISKSGGESPTSSVSPRMPTVGGASSDSSGGALNLREKTRKARRVTTTAPDPLADPPPIPFEPPKRKWIGILIGVALLIGTSILIIRHSSAKKYNSEIGPDECDQSDDGANSVTPASVPPPCANNPASPAHPEISPRKIVRLRSGIMEVLRRFSARRWNDARDYARDLDDELRRNKSNPDIRSLWDEYTALLTAIDGMQAAESLKSNREQANKQFQTIAAAPDFIRSVGVKFTFHLKTNPDDATITLLDADNVAIPYPNTSISDLCLYDPIRTRAVKIEKPGYATARFDLSPKAAGAATLYISDGIPEIVFLGRQADWSVSLPGNLLGAAWDQDDGVIAILESGGVIRANLDSNRTTTHTIRIVGGTINRIIGWESHNTFYLCHTTTSGFQGVSALNFERFQPLIWSQTIDGTLVAGPFSTLDGRVYVACEDGLRYFQINDRKNVRFVPISGSVSSVQRDGGSLLVGTRLKGLLAFDMNTLSVSTLATSTRGGAFTFRAATSQYGRAAVDSKGTVYTISRAGETSTISLPAPASAHPLITNNGIVYIPATDGKYYMVSGDTVTALPGISGGKKIEPGYVVGNDLYWLENTRLLGVDATGTRILNIRLNIAGSSIAPPVKINRAGKTSALLQNKRNLYLYNLPIQK